VADNDKQFELKYEDRFSNNLNGSNRQMVDNLQHDPNKMTVVDFKQDYTVLIRKKLYYAINQQNNENYVKIFQINNFVSLRTSNSVYGKGAASITMKGGERVVVADKANVADKDWGSFEEILYGWNNVDNEGDGGSWRKWKDPSDPNGKTVDYGNLMKVREQKYGWAVAEKCDFEPMDEIYIFGKSKREKSSDGSYKFIQLFFGYIGTVTKSYSAGTNGSIISIEAKDHLKLLEISRIANRPAMDMRVVVPGSRLDGDGFWVIEDDYRYNGIDPDTLQPLQSGASFVFTNSFAGKRADEIIKQVCIEAGIPQSKIKKRIEPTDRTPFTIQYRGAAAELFNGDFKTRLSFAQQAAEILSFEFFADEEGNIVWKIPNYNVGINRLTANNVGFDATYLYDVGGALYQAGSKTITETKEIIKTREVDTDETVRHTVVKGDTLWALAGKYLGFTSKWPEIWKENKSQIKNPHWIYPGQVLTIIKKGTGKKTEIYTEKIQVPKTVKAEKNVNSLSRITDDKIPVIYPWEIIAFTFRDSDDQVFTAASVTAEMPVIGPSGNGVTQAVQRAIQDPLLMAKFGVRVFPPVTSPPVFGAVGAQMYANLLLVRSLSNRYTGSLQMIEESSLRVGDPIRFHLYDEHPFPEMYQGDSEDMNSPVNAQAIFYVDQIDRTIQPSGVSTMSLSLRAGRVMGQSSIYDKCVNLYRKFYEPDAPASVAPEDPKVATTTQTYKVVKGDTLSKVAAKFYGTEKVYRWKEIMIANKLDGPGIQVGQELKIP
jgi:nucleoid-associated protein YgaU